MDSEISLENIMMPKFGKCRLQISKWQKIDFVQNLKIDREKRPIGESEFELGVSK